MNLAYLPIGITEWSDLPTSTHPGESGAATVRTRQFGDVQLRVVEYSPGYVADHWCDKGHIVYVLAGQLVIEHEHGQKYALTKGASYHVPDEKARHRVRSEQGATIFVVD